MINKIKRLRKDELVRGSITLFILILIYNFFNYLFQISMAKNLGPSDYGILAVLMSIIYVFSIPSEAIQTVITKYTAQFSAKRKMGNIKDLLIRSLNKGVIFAFLLFIIYVIVSLFLSEFLRIDIRLMLLTGILIFLVFVLPVARGVLQGTKKFSTLGFNLIAESVTKLIFSLVLVFIGWKVYGAIGAVILGNILAFFLVLHAIKPIIKTKRQNKNFNDIYRGNLPILIATISIVLMYSLDIILARRFFSPEISGQFAFVSLIGKVIIFVGSSIGKTLFPISSENHIKGNKTRLILSRSLAMISSFSVVSLIFYYIFPETIIRIISLGSDQYIGASNILFILGLSYSLLSISYVMILHKLSVNKVDKAIYLTLVFVLIQLLLFFDFHSNLIEYSAASLFSNLLIFLYSIFLLKK